MKVVFKEALDFPPAQMCSVERDGVIKNYNVDLLILNCREKQPQMINVCEIYKQDSIIDYEYAIANTNQSPIIIVKFEDGTYEVLDGSHRLYKAFYEGQKRIMAYVLEESELERYLL